MSRLLTAIMKVNALLLGSFCVMEMCYKILLPETCQTLINKNVLCTSIFWLPTYLLLYPLMSSILLSYMICLEFKPGKGVVVLSLVFAFCMTLFENAFFYEVMN